MSADPGSHIREQPTKRQKISKYRGVSYRPGSCEGKNWEAKIYTNKKSIVLGAFETEENAAKFYDHIAHHLKLRGLHPNFPNECLEGDLLALARSCLDSIALKSSTGTINVESSITQNTPPTTQSRNNRVAGPANANKCLGWDKAKSNFRSEVAEGPVYVCSCCRQLWLKRSVTCLTDEKKISFPLNNLTGELSKDNRKYVCWTCFRSLSKGKSPSLSPLKVPDFPALPPELQNLIDPENHLISPRIPFMQVCAAPCGKRLHLSGSVVNVPADTQRIQTLLPRRWGTQDTVAKRRLRFKQFFRFENVRPTKIREALKYLCENSPLWQSAGVTLKRSWLFPIRDRKCVRQLRMRIL
jgi:hypothetical protein